MRQIDRLNQALRVWEDACYIANAGSRAESGMGRVSALPLAGPFKHYPELREYLLSARVQDFDIPRFCGNSESFLQYLKSYCMLPYALHCWNRESRRVFSIEEDLQILLDATSLDRICWNDVRMPFDSFVVALGRPLRGENHTFDSMLINTVKSSGKGRRIEFRLFPSNFDEYIPVSNGDRKRIERALHQSRWEEAWSLVNVALQKLRKERMKCSVSIFSVDLEHGDMLVTESIVKLAKQLGMIFLSPKDAMSNSYEWDEAARIVVGLCLYLQTLPPTSVHRSEWQKLSKRAQRDASAITDGVSICTVSSSYKLRRDEREAIGLEAKGEQRCPKGFEVRAHFRMGHWRRAPGTGDDPSAPKIVHVRPTIVRHDRLAENELPGGTETIL